MIYTFVESFLTDTVSFNKPSKTVLLVKRNLLGRLSMTWKHVSWQRYKPLTWQAFYPPTFETHWSHKKKDLGINPSTHLKVLSWRIDLISSLYRSFCTYCNKINSKYQWYISNQIFKNLFLAIVLNTRYGDFFLVEYSTMVKTSNEWN